MPGLGLFATRARCSVHGCGEKGVPLRSPDGGGVLYFCSFHVDCPVDQGWEVVDVEVVY